MGIIETWGREAAYQGSSMGRYAVLRWMVCEEVTREVNRNRRLEMIETFIRSRTE